MSNICVLMVGNSPKVKGGISSVISQLQSYNWDDDGVNMAFIPTYEGGSNLHKVLFFGHAYLDIRKYILEKKPDIVHIHMSYKGSFSRKYMIHQLCIRNGIVDVVHMHGSEFELWYEKLNKKRKGTVKKLLDESGKVIVLGDRWEHVVKTIVPSARTMVISNAVSIPEEKAQWSREEFHILFMGVLIKRKGVADLLQAIKIVSEQNIGKKITLVIAGEGEEEENLRNLCKTLGLESVVKFTGWVDGKRKKELLLESQLFVLPSYNEGLPVAVLEAMSYGLPVLATDVGDISDAVTDGENGFIIKPGDIATMGKIIGEIARDEKAFHRMSESSKNVSREQFSEEAFLLKIKKCYMELTEKSDH